LVERARNQIFSAQKLEKQFEDEWLWEKDLVKELVSVVKNAQTTNKDWITDTDYKTKLWALKTIAIMTWKYWPSAPLVDAFKMLFWLHWIKSWDAGVNVNLNFTKLLYWQ